MKEYKFFLKDVIQCLKENIVDLKEKRLFADESEKEYINARLFSYHEIVSSIKVQLKDYKITPEEIGLDKLDNIL
jgi:uncharacterized protein (DUF342 family)